MQLVELVTDPRSWLPNSNCALRIKVISRDKREIPDQPLRGKGLYRNQTTKYVE
jgi:hypothetical protein